MPHTISHTPRRHRRLIFAAGAFSPLMLFSLRFLLLTRFSLMAMLLMLSSFRFFAAAMPPCCHAYAMLLQMLDDVTPLFRFTSHTLFRCYAPLFSRGMMPRLYADYAHAIIAAILVSHYAAADAACYAPLFSVFATPVTSLPTHVIDTRPRSRRHTPAFRYADDATRHCSAIGLCLHAEFTLATPPDTSACR